MNIWFTSDTHYHHNNIIKYCNRPFSDVDHMNEMLIQKHNERVKQGDVVFHLGDFAFDLKSGDNIRKIRRRLNGQIFLIEGNHDHIDSTTAREFGWVKDYHSYKLHNHIFIMCHYPFLTWDKQFHASINLHGHTHQKHAITQPGKKQIHVGVDSWDYYPASYDAIRSLAKQQCDISEPLREGRHAKVR